MKIRVITVIMYVLMQTAVSAQCRIDSRSFAPGEVLTYNAYYNWGFIWVNAGEVEFRVMPAKYEGRDVHHLYAYGASFKSYDWIFKIREKYQAYIDPDTQMPLWYERDVTEGTYTAFEDYRFDYPNSTIHTYVQKGKNPATEGTLPLTPCIMDVLSAVYYFRSVDFSKYRTGDKIPLHMILDSRSYQLYMRYLGREEVRTRNRDRYSCIKFAIQLVEGTVFKGDEDAIVWVTDDENRVPVIVEAQILVGSVKAILNSTAGLKH